MKIRACLRDFALPLAAFCLLSGQTAKASLLVTYAENPGDVNSTLSGTSVYDFNLLSANSQQTDLTWDNGAGQTVGNIDQVYVHSADQYGGADNTNYAVQSTSVGGSYATPVTTLTFPSPVAYFGLWWSAGDANNVMTFYNGTTELGMFTTKDLLGQLPTAKVTSPGGGYYGNPTSGAYGQDSNEAFAFINFYGLSGETITKVVFSNIGSSGFESDNWTVRTGAWGTGAGETGAPAGVALETIPEPSPLMCVQAGLALLALRRRR